MTPLSTAMLAASLLLATPTFAAPPNGPAPEMHGEHKPDRRADRMAERQTERWEKQLTELKASLKLTPAQAPAWDTFHAAMKPAARDAAANRENFTREDWAKMKTPERLDRLRAWRQQRDAAATQRDDATRAFYAMLNADQQKTFDTRMERPYFGGEPGGPGPR